MTTARLALIGDRSPTVRAHGRIPLLIDALRRREGLVLDPYWIATTDADDPRSRDHPLRPGACSTRPRPARPQPRTRPCPRCGRLRSPPLAHRRAARRRTPPPLFHWPPALRLCLSPPKRKTTRLPSRHLA